MSYHVQWYHSCGDIFDATLTLQSTGSQTALVISAATKNGFHGLITIDDIQAIHSGLDDKFVSVDSKHHDWSFSVEPKQGSSADTINCKVHSQALRDDIVHLIRDEMLKIVETQQNPINAYGDSLDAERHEIESTLNASKRRLSQRRDRLSRLQSTYTHKLVEKKRNLEEYLGKLQVLRDQMKVEKQEFDAMIAFEREMEERQGRSLEDWKKKVLEDEERFSQQMEYERCKINERRSQMQQLKVDYEIENQMDEEIAKIKQVMFETELFCLEKEQAFSVRACETRIQRAQRERDDKQRFASYLEDIEAEYRRIEQEVDNRRQEDAFSGENNMEFVAESKRILTATQHLIWEREREIVGRLRKENAQIRCKKAKMEEARALLSEPDQKIKDARERIDAINKRVEEIKQEMHHVKAGWCWGRLDNAVSALEGRGVGRDSRTRSRNSGKIFIKVQSQKM